MSTNKRIRIHGDRTCLQCKGICHEDSLRRRVPSGFGFRSHYFCSRSCLKTYYELKFYQPVYAIYRRHEKLDEFEQEMEKMAEEVIADRYEFVDVITR